MPELPEVETTRRGLKRMMQGRRIVKAEARTKKLRFALPVRFTARLTGARIKELTRRAKYMLIALSTGETLLVHLGMSGRMSRMAKKDTVAKHDHVILHLSDGTRVVFNDPRRFGLMDVWPTKDIANHKLLAAIGPEPLSRDLNPATLAAALQGKKVPIKQALLDQTIVAGLGNIYVSEALFWSGIRPTRKAGSLTIDELRKLVPAIKKVLRAALKAGGSSLRDYVQADGKLGYFQNRHAVYDRTGQRCPGCTCGENAIRKIVQGGRSTFYCPYKQH